MLPLTRLYSIERCRRKWSWPNLGCYSSKPLKNLVTVDVPAELQTGHFLSKVRNVTGWINLLDVFLNEEFVKGIKTETSWCAELFIKLHRCVFRQTKIFTVRLESTDSGWYLCHAWDTYVSGEYSEASIRSCFCTKGTILMPTFSNIIAGDRLELIYNFLYFFENENKNYIQGSSELIKIHSFILI
jgi:hypothetical protein